MKVRPESFKDNFRRHVEEQMQVKMTERTEMNRVQLYKYILYIYTVYIYIFAYLLTCFLFFFQKSKELSNAVPYLECLERRQLNAWNLFKAADRHTNCTCTGLVHRMHRMCVGCVGCEHGNVVFLILYIYFLDEKRCKDV